MKKICKNYLEIILRKITKRASKEVARGRYNDAISYIAALSYLNYKFYIGYKSDFIESTIQALSGSIKRDTFKYHNAEKAIVVVDTVCTDRIGLSYQYMSGLVQSGYSILYVYCNEFVPVRCDDIMGLFKGCDKADTVKIPSGMKGMKRAQWIYDKICGFGANKILLHLPEWAVEENIAASALPKEIERFRVNLADHTFWTGSKSIDYIFEFRNYGCNLSLSERGIEKQNILYLPFYPIMEQHPYEGLPIESDGKFRFLTGGAMYKVIDKGKTFFRLCKAILDKCPNAVILFATGMGNSVLYDTLEEFHLQGRLIPIGYRNDIYEVYKHCDVYINTYPIGGGLMLQYAAQLSMPILNFINDKIEEVVAQKNECHFTYESEETFAEEAYRLYVDAGYRKLQGEVLRKAVVSKDEFDIALNSSILKKESFFKVTWDSAFTPAVYNIQDAIDYVNRDEALTGFYFKFFKLLGNSAFSLLPFDFISFQYVRIKNRLRRIIKRNHNRNK